MNIVSLGAKATICSIIGDDKVTWLNLSLQINISTDGLFKSAEKPTTVKTRIIGNNHQLLRIDRELTDEPSDEIEDTFIHKIKEIIGTHHVTLYSLITTKAVSLKN